MRHSIPVFADMDKLVLLSLNYMVCNGVVTPVQIPVVLTTYVLCQTGQRFDPEQAFRHQHKYRPGKVEAAKELFVSGIGIRCALVGRFVGSFRPCNRGAVA